MSGFKKVIRGLGWMGGLRGFIRVITFARLAILARLLSPLEFGIFGIASLAISLLETLTDTGVNVFFIQKEGKLKDYLDTAWLVSILRGTVISLILFFGSAQIALFFHSSQASFLIKMVAGVSFLRGFINPSVVKFKKELEFHKEFFLRVFTTLADVIVSIVFAVVTKSAFSLVWGMVASVVVEVVISHLLIYPRPSFRLDLSKFKKVLNRGKWVTAAGVFQYLFANGDNIIVGRLMNTISLGYYQMAYRISIIPITEISDVVGTVTFPVFAKIRGNKKALRRLFFKILGGICLLVIPLGLIIFFFTDSVVNILVGSEWLTIIPALKILSIFGMIRAIEGAVPSLFLAVKKQEYVTALTLTSIIGLGITIVPFVSRYGIIGASYSALFGTLISIPVVVYCLWKALR